MKNTTTAMLAGGVVLLAAHLIVQTTRTSEASGVAGGNPACPGVGSCCEPNGTPGCDDITCCNLVCAIDPFCCNIEWDSVCVIKAEVECVPLCGPAPVPGCGDCDAPDPAGAPGCSDPDCEVIVCAINPLCCASAWDQICADEALLSCICVCPWDCELAADGTVGITDFLELLAQWGGPGSCDFGGGGVGITDFLELLANWGPCP